MIQLDNLAEFTRGLEDQIEAWEQQAENQLRALSMAVFEFVVQGTPQWSGELVSQWRVTVGAPAVGYMQNVFKDLAPSGVVEEPYSKERPNTAAVRYTQTLAKEAFPLIRLGADVYITNSTPYGEAVEHDRSEAGRPFVRAVNLPVEMVHAATEKFGGTVSGGET